MLHKVNSVPSFCWAAEALEATVGEDTHTWCLVVVKWAPNHLLSTEVGYL